MTAALRLTPAQQAAEAERRRDGRPDKTAMTSAERLAAGLMDRRMAAEHEHLASVPYFRAAERVTRPDPDDIWAVRDADLTLIEAAVWEAWEAAGHAAKGCQGWSQDLDGAAVCACGQPVPVPSEAAA